ncbi:DNA helicase [Tanacetum coccineum]
MLAYYRYQLHFCFQQYDLLFTGGRLFQQYVVGVFYAVEQNRLDFLRKKQNDIRANYLFGLYDAISRGERDGYKVGGRIILPMSFTDGPRYMYAHYLDTLAIFRKLGNPQFFITFTCNVNWPEIKRFMAQYPELTTSDRADVVCRVFEQKIQSFVTFHKEERIFGNVTRDSESKIKSAEDVDQYISAELPDPRIDPNVYNIVSETMMHGPCRAANMKASCMKGDKCGKRFPKKFNSKTFFNDNGHVHYQRRDTSITTTRNQFKLDNNYVVPYNRDLLLAFLLWVELMGESSTEAAPSQEMVDEIQNYIEGRFICAHEAYWRIFKFDIHHREPAVQILAVHLEDMQRITFRDRDRLRLVVDFLGKKNTTLTEWFAYKGCRDFFEVQTINDVLYPTYRNACEALGQLGDDREWETALEEACASAIFEQLRFVFSHILLHCDVADPSKLWTKYWEQMSQDIPKKVSEKVQIHNYHLNADSLQGYTLYELEIILNNCGKPLQSFGLCRSFRAAS